MYIHCTPMVASNCINYMCVYMKTHLALQPYQGKAFILCHVVDQLVLGAVVWLKVVVHVTKPVELVFILN